VRARLTRLDSILRHLRRSHQVRTCAKRGVNAFKYLFIAGSRECVESRMRIIRELNSYNLTVTISGYSL